MRPFPDLNPLKTDALVDALARIHHRRQPLPEAIAQEVKESAEKSAQHQIFDTAQHQLGLQEQQLRSHAQLTKTIVGQLKSRQIGLVQRLVRLAGPVGGDFRGRFLVENETGKQAVFTFKTRFLQTCEIDPPTITLEPGSTAPITLTLPRLSGTPATTLELALDVEASGHLRARIWVEIRFDPA